MTFCSPAVEDLDAIPTTRMTVTHQGNVSSSFHTLQNTVEPRNNGLASNVNLPITKTILKSLKNVYFIFYIIKIGLKQLLVPSNPLERELTVCCFHFPFVKKDEKDEIEQSQKVP